MADARRIGGDRWSGPSEKAGRKGELSRRRGGARRLPALRASGDAQQDWTAGRRNALYGGFSFNRMRPGKPI